MSDSKDDFIQDAVLRGGLTEDEALCLWHIIQAWETFCNLPKQHQEDSVMFLGAIHQQQHIIAMRAVRKISGGFWHSPG